MYQKGARLCKGDVLLGRRRLTRGSLSKVNGCAFPGGRGSRRAVFEDHLTPSPFPAREGEPGSSPPAGEVRWGCPASGRGRERGSHPLEGEAPAEPSESLPACGEVRRGFTGVVSPRVVPPQAGGQSLPACWKSEGNQRGLPLQTAGSRGGSPSRVTHSLSSGGLRN